LGGEVGGGGHWTGDTRVVSKATRGAVYEGGGEGGDTQHPAVHPLTDPMFTMVGWSRVPLGEKALNNRSSSLVNKLGL
jgi:hypothetical protein